MKAVDFPGRFRLLEAMATATLPQPAARKRLWTFDEMLAELGESNLPIELWDGEVIRSPTPVPNHQRIVSRLYKLMDAFVEERELGEVFISPLDVILSQHRVVQPDVFFISKARLKLVTDRVRCAPDLAVEVISEGSWRRDRVDKKDLYEQFAVREYWIVDPEAQTIEVFALEKGAFKLASRAEQSDTASSELLSGFTVAWSQLVL